MLSTPSLGITRRRHVVRRGRGPHPFNSLSRDHSGSLGEAEKPHFSARAFNSLSRDHVQPGPSTFWTQPQYFQLPLSGSPSYQAKPLRYFAQSFQLPLSGSRSLWNSSGGSRTTMLSTPSLGITGRSGRALDVHLLNFQLPLSGSLPSRSSLKNPDFF